MANVEVISRVIEVADNFILVIQSHLIDRGLGILAMRGLGKNYTTGVIAEELAKAGQSFIIIDLMDEYYTLREQFPIIIPALRESDYADLKGLSNEAAKPVAERMVETGISCVLDLKHGTMAARYDAFITYLGGKVSK